MLKRLLRGLFLGALEAVELSDADAKRIAKQLNVSENFVRVVFGAIKSELINLVLRGKFI